MRMRVIRSATAVVRLVSAAGERRTCGGGTEFPDSAHAIAADAGVPSSRDADVPRPSRGQALHPVLPDLLYVIDQRFRRADGSTKLALGDLDLRSPASVGQAESIEDRPTPPRRRRLGGARGLAAMEHVGAGYSRLTDCTTQPPACSLAFQLSCGSSA